MSGETDAEHVKALALQPIRALVHAPDARHLEHGRAAREAHLESQEAAKRQRPQMPHDLERPLRIAILDRGDVREIVVPLTGIVVEPAHDLEELVVADDDVRLPPHHVDLLDRVAEALLERRDRWIGAATAVRDAARRGGCRRVGCRAADDDGSEARAHSPDRVW